MGSFFLTSKKASATLVFLVISIIIVSSGVIITNQIKKSNDDNAAGTGLILLNSEQENSQYSDSSDEGTKIFTFENSGGKSSSKKSSDGGGSTDSQTYNEPEILDNDEIADSQTSENQTEANSTEEINETETDDFMSFSTEILSRNGTSYIMREGEEYVLSTSSSAYYIEFNPALPSSVCENEGIDITVRGYGSYSPTMTELVNCAFDQYLDIGWCVKLMEDDLSGDDVVRNKCGIGRAYVSIDYPYCNRFYFEATFSNVDLSDWIIPDPGGSGEFYAKLENGYGNDGTVQYMSTPSYKVYAYVNNECDCLSGSCCDLSSRPYKFKPYGSSCGTCRACDSSGHCSKTPSDDSACGIRDCSNWYVKTGTQSPTTNQWCYNKKDITSNRCEAFGNCKDSNTADCNSQSNDQLKYYCGVCKFISTGDCTGTTKGSCSNYYKHVSCGTNNECDGFGTCVTCTTHSYTNCWYGDVYWYDACDNREEKKLPDCGEDSYTDWWLSSYCVGDNLYVPRTYYNRGCRNRVCYVDSLNENVFVKTCANGCSNGGCIIECSSDSDCGENYWDYFCGDGSWQIADGNAYKMYIESKCKYPSSDSSYCYFNYGNPILVEICLYGCSNGVCIVECSSDSDCEEDSYGDNYCSNDDVYQNFTNRGCLDGACFENTTPQFVQECGAEGCLNGECLYVECYNDTMCGPDDDYVGDPFCHDGDVWQDQVAYTCNYLGTGNSYCSNSTAPQLKEPCGSDYCENWGSNYCNLDDLYHERTCYDKGCSGGICFDNIDTEEEKVQECGTSEYTGNSYCYNNDVYRDYITRGCSYSRCTSSTSEKKTEDCEHGCISGRCKIEICNYGMCYYV